jgi:hypothetical protein
MLLAKTIVSAGLGMFLTRTLFALRFTDWLTQWTWKRAIVTALIFVVTFVVATGLVSLIVVKLPATYFHPDHDREVMKNRHPVLRWVVLITKNLGGVILILLGIVMSLPGIPGPGLVTILFGIMLLDFPGKRRLESKMVSHPKVLKSINDLRKKFGKPPLKL